MSTDGNREEMPDEGGSNSMEDKEEEKPDEGESNSTEDKREQKPDEGESDSTEEKPDEGESDSTEDNREEKPDESESNSNPADPPGNTSRPYSPSQSQSQRRTLVLPENLAPIFVVASLYKFGIDKDKERNYAGFPYLTYIQGEIFDVIGTKGEIWLAKNQDDENGELGWIWCKHFARLSTGEVTNHPF